VKIPLLAAFAVVLTGMVSAQDFPPGSRAPTVAYYPPEVASVYRGHPGAMELQFRVPAGFHINSNHPKQEYLKKTELKLDAPTDIAIVKISYPEGVDQSFSFDPSEKLNVYSGDFTVKVLVRPLRTVLPARYAVHGTLKYQACDNAACYPPKQMPVSFEIKVLKSSSENHRRNPGQSPPR
jgi:hypothetical protein